MTSRGFDLPTDLEVPDFWRLPSVEWKNITKFDFFYITKTLEAKKDVAHVAYKNDIEKMLFAVAKKDANAYHNLNACKNSVKQYIGGQQNKGNQLFWATKAAKVLNIAVKELTVEKELKLLEKLTAIDVLRERRHGNKKSNSSSNSSSRDNSNDNENNNSELADVSNASENGACSSNNNSGNTSSSSSSNSNNDINVATHNKRKSEFDDEPLQSKQSRALSTIIRDFDSFKRAALHQASSDAGLCMESHVHHLLSLQNILLLTPSQYPRSMRELFGDDCLKELEYTLFDVLSEAEENEPWPDKAELDSLIYSLKKGRKTVLQGIQGLLEMTQNKPEAQANVLVGLANLIQKLPKRTLLEEVPKDETELWSSVFDPVLTPMFSCPGRDMLLRWSNVIPSEGSVSGLQVRPDAIICEVDQLKWGISMGYGELKLSEPTRNADVLGRDLIRLAMLSRKTIMETRLETVFTFQIHGYNLNAYVAKMVPGTHILAMYQFDSLVFPKSMEELDSFTTQANIEKLMGLHNLFWKHCYIGSKQEKVAKEQGTDDHTELSAALDISTLDVISQSSVNRHH